MKSEENGPGIGHNSQTEFTQAHQRVKELLAERKRLAALPPHQRLRSIADHVLIHASRIARGENFVRRDGVVQAKRGDATLIQVLLAVAILCDNSQGQCFGGVKAICEKAFPDETVDAVEKARRRVIVEKKLAALTELGVVLAEQRRGQSSFRVIAPTEPVRVTAEVATPSTGRGEYLPLQEEGGGNSPPSPRDGTPPSPEEGTPPLGKGGQRDEREGCKGGELAAAVPPTASEDGRNEHLDWLPQQPTWMQIEGKGFVASLPYEFERDGVAKSGTVRLHVEARHITALAAGLKVNDPEARQLIVETLAAWRENGFTGGKRHAAIDNLLKDCRDRHEQALRLTKLFEKPKPFQFHQQPPIKILTAEDIEREGEELLGIPRNRGALN